MRPINQLTPYPVLAAFRDDYLNSAFNARIVGSQQFGDLQLQVSFELREPYLKDLISQGMAEYAIHIECPPASYRTCVRTSQDAYSLKLDRTIVRDVVEVCTYIVASRDIRGFRSPNFHPDYDGISFDIGSGGILAIGHSSRLKVRDAEDMARHPSILKVMSADPSQKESMTVVMEKSSNVLISLRPDLYEAYVLLGDGSRADVILSMVIMPALQLVLTRMRGAEDPESPGDSDYQGLEWYESMVELLRRNGISVKDIDNFNNDSSALAIAQKILSDPLERSLRGLLAEEVRE